MSGIILSVVVVRMRDGPLPLTMASTAAGTVWYSARVALLASRGKPIPCRRGRGEGERKRGGKEGEREV